LGFNIKKRRDYRRFETGKRADTDEATQKKISFNGKTEAVKEKENVWKAG
jgi:hypothetical protein